MAARIVVKSSSGVSTQPAISACVESSQWVPCVTHAPCAELWYGTSRYVASTFCRNAAIISGETPSVWRKPWRSAIAHPTAASGLPPVSSLSWSTSNSHSSSPCSSIRATSTSAVVSFGRTSGEIRFETELSCIVTAGAPAVKLFLRPSPAASATSSASAAWWISPSAEPSLSHSICTSHSLSDESIWPSCFDMMVLSVDAPWSSGECSRSITSETSRCSPSSSSSPSRPPRLVRCAIASCSGLSKTVSSMFEPHTSRRRPLRPPKVKSFLSLWPIDLREPEPSADEPDWFDELRAASGTPGG